LIVAAQVADSQHATIASAGACLHTYRMAQKFYGSLQEFKDKLLPADIDGEWQEQPNSVWKLRTKDKAGVLWSATKGTVWYDGPEPQKGALAAKVEGCLSDGAVAIPADPKGSTIFVVHGRDKDSRDQLELILRRLGLEPFVLQITGGGGDTLIEVLEKMIGKAAQALSVSS
jgi:hypothetical protein